ncbi:MAG: 50S ribosomal protein L23 [Candidatus Magasanikbacteria bacterium RIFCSPLOWO2_01_FULL_43_20b]|uniref:Large ribosomal subunit protein uL23 n=1 Tax=Candidatus Magasanikbacteria bacterium RIFCSPLOWO2_12_FULL_43_12 TaxID=1798692 RepID=A0A1F6MTQ3_9BACT|nr:MAG: 50S ribosomal protein L23 [Candidatus Magasanikbacteria bacterium RIFCSPHIGHO2_02_FULL_44_13]OGH71911.1 MAG: 50S ribosomal protein L23 [Candidatus Magasanikbacteria bacterium RIFCSPLOWO2_02_FULL_43_22]OGH73546.1 MAG: 50S ribosomal protein L23 [Candidatus Magasanikbacteria bacterium RIFCSPLOWO2_01_FULL_43_20b]OGH75075.1 MAG: 50S ribosomal protein L23 [Candidatus Magasanikbacteria bacterium RIFCSPLOWO2_12_FULL_43_12]
MNSNAHRVLQHPLVSEKAAVAEANSVYTFVINRKASKDAVRQAIKDIYGVSPDRVRMINVEGKKARHGRSLGRRGDWRKALVTLPKGQTISAHEGV